MTRFSFVEIGTDCIVTFPDGSEVSFDLSDLSRKAFFDEVVGSDDVTMERIRVLKRQLSGEAFLRVGVLLYASPQGAAFLGYGVFIGNTVPGAEAAGAMAKMLRMGKRPNATIVMDDGEVVWGCEVWWNVADEMRRYLEELREDKVKLVTVEEFRREYFEGATKDSKVC